MQGKPAALALFLALAITLSFPASCPSAVRDIYLAAVMGESAGGIVQLEVEVHPGNGSIYTAVSPRTGYSTQESEDAAVRYAFSSTGFDQSGCDVLFTMKGNFGDNRVDGPSAGAAMAVAARAALLNKTVRQDVAMTGTMAHDGRIGPIGGVIEKALAAQEAGAKYFVAPRLQVYEALLLSSATRGQDFSVIEARNISDAERVVLSGPTATFQPTFSPESTPMPKGIAALPLDADTARFALVAGRVVGGLEAKVKAAFAAPAQDSQSSALRAYFADEIAKYRKAIAMGYPFTAANAAFQLSVDAEYAKIGGRGIDINGSFSDVNDCIASLGKPRKTFENFQWAAGADLRRAWAIKKLNETAEAREGQEGYTTLRDLLYANSWCSISSELSSQAIDIGGSAANESLLAHLADQKLASAKAALDAAEEQDPDSVWHYETGLLSNESGNYGAAAYDATYAMTMQRMASSGALNASAEVQGLSHGNMSSLWGKIYHAHGLYLASEGNESGAGQEDAYRILAYASELDRATAEMESALAAGRNATPPVAAQEKLAYAPANNRQSAPPGPLFSLQEFAAGVAIGLAGAAAVWLALAGGKREKASGRKRRVQ